MNLPLITLTTDFGLSDEYVGVMKGVIYTICPTARIVDISHNIRPQDVRQAARIIFSSYRYFPAGAIHVVVVDPDVGSSRRIILLEADGHLFLVPDNGVASLLLPRTQKIYEIDNTTLYRHPVSPTFHGRDIFAPIAAHLASHLAPHSAGSEIARDAPVRLDFAVPSICGNIMRGIVTDIDHFGNLITNIDKERAGCFCSHDFHRLKVHAGALTIHGIVSSYNAVRRDEPLALFGSRNLLEIGINQGNASTKLRLGLDSPICLSI
ncbi:MAG: SAM-dependent chlorinase/fluorinase [Deltaproteobacteria bacterium]|nr:SAM-dependent chlorinase/fluorinase [Deltaproteobacteria bacterium]